MRPARAVAASTLIMLITTAAYVGCASVPDIRFVDDSADSGGGDTLIDGARMDGAGGSDGAVARDATASCTTASPGGGATCCGAVWCVGDCSSTNCDECARGCQSGEFCCGKTGTVMCKTKCP